MSAEIITFGCRLNLYESEVMKDHANAAGLNDAIIFNTCAVTQEAERQARQAIRRAKRKNPDAKIIVTGCAAQIKPEAFAAMPEVDTVLGNAEKMQATSWLSLPAAGEKLRVNDIMSINETASHMLSHFDGQTRAFVQVQNGCNHRCTFCIIPYGRGNSRSVPMKEVIAEIRQLVARGFKEVVLTGVDVSSYGEGLPDAPTLGDLCAAILRDVPELPRLRLSSIDAVEIDNTLWRLIAEESRLMPHLHLSLQAGDDMILKRMKRRHLRADAIALCNKARDLRPDMVFGADIIAGFPTETEDMFDNSLWLVEECGLTYLHIFPYSPREGTPAAKMPQVPMPVRKERAARLRAAGEAQEQAFYQQLDGTMADILVEKDGIGRTAQFAPVQCDGHAPGSLIKARLASQSGTIPLRIAS